MPQSCGLSMTFTMTTAVIKQYIYCFITIFMRYTYLLLVLFIGLLPASSCNGIAGSKSDNDTTLKTKEKESYFPKVMPVDSLKHTVFVPSLNNELPARGNVIYTPAFLLAWDTVQGVLGGPFTLQGADKMLQEVAATTGFKSALARDEYDIKVERSRTDIKITSLFNKSLPFASDMDTIRSHNRPFLFSGCEVKAFGMEGYNPLVAEQMRLLYYVDDDHFILCITPKDSTQELILAKGTTTGQTMADVLKETDRLIGEGMQQEKSDDPRYKIRQGDRVMIPALAFNLKKKYNNFEGATLHLKDDIWRIDEATQRTAFVLNEHGAAVEGEDTITMTLSIPDHPKLLSFDKPFVVMLRKKGVEQPYVMMRIDNAELMVKR